MIEPRYVQTMARYNSWQNNQLSPVLNVMSIEDLTKDRGAFFGSLLGTANHLLWGDTLWMNRFTGTVAAPDGEASDHTQSHKTIASWTAARLRMDVIIQDWADGLEHDDLTGDLTWFSQTAGRDMSSPMSTFVVSFLNHQTHHRGQIHAMLTAAGQRAPVSDLIFMPEDN
ncbi:MAG: DinB family protein [Roseobacter sp.]